MLQAKVGLMHHNFPGYSLDDFFDYARLTGFTHVELQIGDIWSPDDKDPEREASRVRELLDVYDLAVSALGSANDFVYLDEKSVNYQVERMRRICDIARILGTDLIRTEGGRPKNTVPKERWVEAMAGCLTRCLDFVKEKGIRLAVDNHGLITNDADLVIELFERVGTDYVGANLDTMNYRWFGHDLEEVNRFFRIISPYVLHTHMKDGRGVRENYVGVVLGEGEVDLSEAIRCLRQADYSGVWCVEYEGGEPAASCKACYEYLKRHLR